VSRPRDTYRQRCYSAERKVFGWYTVADHFDLALPDWAAVEKFAQRIERSEWRGHGRKPVTLVRRTKGANRSDANRRLHRIRIAPTQFRKDVLVHEYAHILTPERYAGHGPEWVGCYLDGIKALLGSEPAVALAVELSRRNVPGAKLPGHYR
jgi:hypothetical protein